MHASKSFYYFLIPISKKIPYRPSKNISSCLTSSRWITIKPLFVSLVELVGGVPEPLVRLLQSEHGLQVREGALFPLKQLLLFVDLFKLISSSLEILIDGGKLFCVVSHCLLSQKLLKLSKNLHYILQLLFILR